MTSILIVFCPQVDYLTAGLYPVPNGESILNNIKTLFPKYDEVIIVQEWFHPLNEVFAGNHLWRRPGQELEIAGNKIILQETHCIRNSFGAMISSDFNEEDFQILQTQLSDQSYTASLFSHSQTKDLKEFKEIIAGKNLSYCGFTNLDFFVNTINKADAIANSQVLIDDLFRLTTIYDSPENWKEELPDFLEIKNADL